MKDRLLQLLNKLNYSATRLADELDVQRSGISHILSGRNQPSFDFMVKILNRFPQIDAEWLILGKGNMFKSPVKDKKEDKKEETTLFNAPEVTKVSTPENHGTNKLQVTNVNSITTVILLNSEGTFNIYNKATKD